MKIISKGRRLLLFVLAFAMLLTMLPPLSVPAQSDGLVDSLASNSDPVDYGANIGAVAAELFERGAEYEQKIEKVLEEFLFNIGGAEKAGADYILNSLRTKAELRKKESKK